MNYIVQVDIALTLNFGAGAGGTVTQTMAAFSEYLYAL